MKMKRFTLVFIIGMFMILSARTCISATVNTPMTEDLDANGYTISNVGDLITAGPVADVRAFGADPTGTNDSYPALYNASRSGVGTVFIPKGTYRLDSPLTLWVNFIAEDGVVTINYYGAGTAITLTGSPLYTGRTISGFKLVSKASNQNGVCLYGGIFQKVKNLVIDDFDGIGLQVGVAGVAGSYFCDVSEVYCRNTTVQGTTGLLVDGCSVPNSNANIFKNIAVKGKWTTLYHIKGNDNLFLMGNAEVNTSGTGCDDVWKIEGGGNEVNGCYYEMGGGEYLADSIFRFTSTAYSNRIKNIHFVGGLYSAYASTNDQGWANEVSFKPIGYNFPFPVENKGVENLIPNSHFKHFSNGSTGVPAGWKVVFGGASFTRNSTQTRGAKYSLEATSYINCYIAGDPSSATGYPINRFRGKSVVAGVWAKSTVSNVLLKIAVDGTGGATFGANTHTGDGTWQFLTAMVKVPEDATYLTLQLRGTSPATYFSEPVFAEGVHLPHPNPRPLNDGYARMMGPFIGSPFMTFSNGDTTPDVSDGNNFKTANTSATTITDFINGTAGQEIIVIFTDANTMVSDAGNLKLSGSFTSAVNSTLKLIYDGTNWQELSRSFN